MQQQSISIVRFIDQLDRCFDRGDMRAARECIRYWTEEARTAGDDRALLSIQNEAVGYYRRTQKKGKAIAAMQECLSLIEKLGIGETLSAATIFVNAATTMSFFGQPEESLPLYEKAAVCYEEAGKTDTYEYAALLNNKAAALDALERYPEAGESWKKAIAILDREGNHDGEIAISLICLAHLTYEKKLQANADEADAFTGEIEALLDQAWEYINSPRITQHDGNYAYVLKKCAPSFAFFGRGIEAQALRETVQEIYELARKNMV